MKSSSIIDAKRMAQIYLTKYIEQKEYSYLDKALSLDNTNSSILFHYLNYLKNIDQAKFHSELKKFRLFLDEESCSKLNINYINHKKEIFHLIDLMQEIDANIFFDLTEIKEALKKYNSEEEQNILKNVYEKYPNNLPLNDFKDDIIFYLTIKKNLFKHLLSLVNRNINDDFSKDDLYMGISYLKIYSLILKYYLEKDDREKAFALVCLLDFEDYYTEEYNALKRLVYYLKQIKLDLKEIEVKSRLLYSRLVEIEQASMIGTDKFKSLYFQIIEKILTSQTIKQLIEKLREHIGYQNKIITIDDSFINYIKSNIIFTPFFRSKTYGLTVALNGKILINNVCQNSGGLTHDEIDLYNFCIWIVTGIHEIVSHLLKHYYYYLTDATIKEKFQPRICTKYEEIEEEGENLVDELLFKNEQIEYIGDIIYILNINNWNKSLDNFSSYFSSEERKKIISKERIKSIELFGLIDESIKILSKFDNIKKMLDYYKAYKIIRIKNYRFPKRICLTHLKRQREKRKENIFLVKF